MAITKIKISFSTSVILLVVLIFSVYTISSLTVLNISISQSVEGQALQIFGRESQDIKSNFDRIFQISSTIVNLIDNYPSYQKFDGYKDPQEYLYWISLLKNTPSIYSIYLGAADGQFVQMIAILGKKNLTDKFKIPGNSAYMLRFVEQKNDLSIQKYFAYDLDLKLISQTSEVSAYDPRTRPWYVASIKNDKVNFSDPYIFNSSGKPGITVSKKIGETGQVFGIDISLEEFQTLIDRAQLSPNSNVAVLDMKKQFIALTRGSDEVFNESMMSNFETKLGRVERNSKDGNFYWSSRLEINDNYFFTMNIVAPITDFSEVLANSQKNIVFVNVFLVLLLLPLIGIIVQKMSRVMKDLSHVAGEVANFNFSNTLDRRSNIKEIQHLSDGFSFMQKMLVKRNDDLAISQAKLEKIVEIGIAMSAERESNRLMELLLLGAKELSHAEGGTLYLKDNYDQLEFQIVLNDKLKIYQGGTSSHKINLPPVGLFIDSGEENHRNVVTHCFHSEKTISVPDAYHDEKFDFRGTKQFDESMKYHSQSFLTVPLIPRGGKPIGAIQLINSIENDQIVPFSIEIQRFVEALAAAAATALYNRQLIETQRKLFDSLVQFIAGAIDTKSPYTGGHCARVPVIAIMLAEEASKVHTGKLKDFSFKTDEEWREFRIGAWLHDCGKVTTPEFVVDKATKLETIYNRIHEIRTRFEVVLRDMKIESLMKIQKGYDEQKANEEFQNQVNKLKDDFAFVAECNLGGEFMDPGRMARLNEIADITWERHFDERLGMSWEELKRYSGENSRNGTIIEHLLADKSFHKVPRMDDFYHAYEGKGFNVPVPELLYNHGELYNLSISRGTLSDEERFKINEHIMQTIVMLEKLPLPEGMKRIPEYAGTHHEALSGKGYPRSLKDGSPELSIPARIMAIADIFEALTAADRPYKKAKTLSESIKILHSFKTSNHIDAELFDLFLISGTYKNYAAKYLKPEQIDEVDIRQYLG